MPTPTPAAAALQPQETAKQDEPPVISHDSLELFSLAVPELSHQSKRSGYTIQVDSVACGQHNVAGNSSPPISQGHSCSMFARISPPCSEQRDALCFITTVPPCTNTGSDTASTQEESSAPLPDADDTTVQQQQRRTQAFYEQRATKDTFDMTYTCDLLPPPGPNATNDAKMDFIQQQLDGFGRDRPMFDDLLSLGCGDNERRQGGTDSGLSNFQQLCCNPEKR